MSSLWQCSHCFATYPFQEFIDLPHIWIDEKHQEYGKTSVCKCGRPFGIDKWNLRTEIEDSYVVSTVHLELAHTSNINFSFENVWYETMIYDKRRDRFLSFQVRYKTMDEAKEGHELAVQNINKIIENPDKYPQSIIDRFFKLVF